jgi:hypothetical protein
VLPTAEAETPAVQVDEGAGERDDELMRLQRLLGMAKEQQPEVAVADEETEPVDSAKKVKKDATDEEKTD